MVYAVPSLQRLRQNIMKKTFIARDGVARQDGGGVSRRDFIATVSTAASLSMLSSVGAWAAEPQKSLLPLNTPKVDHLDVIVPNVETSARFYMSVFNTKLHAQPFQGSQRYFVL